jgi:hypothetical protein
MILVVVLIQHSISLPTPAALPVDSSSPQPTTMSALDDAQLDHIERIGLEILGMNRGGRRQYSEKIKNRRFIASFGATPLICAIVWTELNGSNWFRRSPARVKPLHLFMGLHFLKGYNTEESNAAMFQCDEKTFRQWSWYIVLGIANLEKRYGRGWSSS